MQIQTDRRTECIIWWATAVERARHNRNVAIRNARLAHNALSAKSWIVIARQAGGQLVFAKQVLRKHAEGSR